MFLDKFREHFDIVWHSDLISNPELGKKVNGALLLASLNYDVFMQQKHLLPNLKVVSNAGVGYDHLDLAAYTKDGIMVTNTPDIGSGAVADHAMALLLASAREIVPGTLWLRKYAKRNLNLLGVEVSDATLGIVGLGSIGFKIAQRALGFNMKILYHQRSRKTTAEESQLHGAEYHKNLEDMLPSCDFVVLACPLTPTTENLLGAKEFALMKSTSILINVARGQVINQDSLVEALKAGQIRGAALDVTTPEPLPLKHPLLEMDNVILTPHAGTATIDTRMGMFMACVGNLKAALIDHTTPPNLIN